ncbi:MAG: cytochrome C [Burkholderiaceae bacterium]
MKTTLAIAGVLFAASFSAQANELSWTKDIKPLVDAQCAACHGAQAPTYWEWRQLPKEEQGKVGPRMDSYGDFMNYVVWPATGAMQRRLDAGKAGGKPGNMYVYLGQDDAERAKNLKLVKDWMGAWNTNRWQARGDTPAVSKEQLEAIKAKY